jgi:hypothetical protein
MAIPWQGLPDTPENRALVLRAHHILSFSIEEMETARLFALGVPDDEIARRVGIRKLEVKANLIGMAARIFIEPNWEAMDGIGCVPEWLHQHAKCCVARWDAEVATTDPNELPEEMRAEHRSLPRWKAWEDAARMREREDLRAPSVRRKKPGRER